MKHTLLALSTALAASLVATPSAACLNEVLKLDEAVKLLATAQDEVDRGELDEARTAARRAGAGRVGWEGTKDEHLVSRAIRIRALADARDPNASMDALQTDEDIIAQERRRHPSDPVLDAEYAELLARIPGRADDAHDILAPLVKRDLVGSPWALAALARVSKDPKEAADARATCERVTAEPFICGTQTVQSAQQQRLFAPASKPPRESIGATVMVSSAAVTLAIAGGLAIVIVRRRRRIAAALAA
jgi:hypothetical protein